MCLGLLTYVTSFMYSNRWLMVEIFPTVFIVIGFLSFEFSGGQRFVLSVCFLHINNIHGDVPMCLLWYAVKNDLWLKDFLHS